MGKKFVKGRAVPLVLPIFTCADEDFISKVKGKNPKIKVCAAFFDNILIENLQHIYIKHCKIFHSIHT
jgi:hypothetical protein